MSEVRRVLGDLVAGQPEARENAEVQAAYQALDNMEGEELEAITQEVRLLVQQQGEVAVSIIANADSTLAEVEVAAPQRAAAPQRQAAEAMARRPARNRCPCHRPPGCRRQEWCPVLEPAAGAGRGFLRRSFGCQFQ